MDTPKPFWDPSFRGNHLNGENATIPGALFNDRDAIPAYQNKSEKPIHRRIVELSLQGFTITEIAEMVSMTRMAVSNILRQPHAREYIVNEAKRTVQDEVKAFLDAELMPSLVAMKNIREDVTAKPSDRLAAAKELADRRLGRAAQPFITNDKPVTELTAEELDAEVQRVLSNLNA